MAFHRARGIQHPDRLSHGIRTDLQSHVRQSSYEAIVLAAGPAPRFGLLAAAIEEHGETIETHPGAANPEAFLLQIARLDGSLGARADGRWEHTHFHELIEPGPGQADLRCHLRH